MAITSLTISSSISTTSTLFANGANYTGQPNVTYAVQPTGVSKVYCKKPITVDTTGTVYDLTNILDAWGAALSFTNVTGIMLKNLSATNSVLLGGGTTPVFAVLPAITAGGQANLTTTLAVGGAAINLKVAAAAATASIELIIVGN